MKRNIVLSAFAGLVCLATAAFAVEVYTPNTVGFIRVDLAAEQWTMVGAAFDQIDGSIGLIDVIGTNLPNQTRVMVWDTENLEYQSTIIWEGVWSRDDITLPRGRGFWIRSRVDTEIFVLGQVPVEAQSSLAIYEGMQMVTSPYPVPVDMNDPNIFLLSEPNNQDRIIAYDGVDYSTAIFWEGLWAGSGVWADGVVLQPGKAYWYRARGRTDITVNNPYGE